MDAPHLNANECSWSHTRGMLDEFPPIQKTLAIPLVGRAIGGVMFPELRFHDPKAAQLLHGVGFSEMDAIARHRSAVWGTLVRTQIFDQLTTQFHTRHENSPILALGVGLCTRVERLPGLRWLEVDTDQVIDARNRLLPISDSTVRIAADLSQPDSLDGVLDTVLDRTRSTEEPVLVLAEGVLMFLDGRVVKELLETLERRLPPNSEVIFDYIHPLVPHLSSFHSSLRTTGARYLSGLVPRKDLATRMRLRECGTTHFTSCLDRRLEVVQKTLTFLARSPLYDIARFRVRDLR